MNCSLPAPWFYEFVMHNLHFISTPIYIICLAALFRETYQVFRVYKYYIIAHSITCVDDVQNYTKVDSNVTSEFYVTFMWLPITYLPYDVYRGTGWLSQWGLSTFGLYISRFFAVVHMMTLTWSTIDDKTIMYQQNKKDALFKKVPDLPKKLGCYSVFILATEDPILILNVVIYSILVCLGSAVGLNFSTLLLFSLAYHGFSSTCATIIFTKQLRVRILYEMLFQTRSCSYRKNKPDCKTNNFH
ncbi:hypothetical protein L3Y34_013010 [Caenorhabditis briggsae]|uniref:Uncharacterized protein n=1 Tax=Caenorhabditis briggsae TaxID=6238 RepID=A0AAE9CX62_CAEBR|nr:hypothetical protein L3Y34_013010 [Caenorhabditis briggsae]